jgi:hypothetical protein
MVQDIDFMGKPEQVRRFGSKAIMVAVVWQLHHNVVGLFRLPMSLPVRLFAG